MIYGSNWFFAGEIQILADWFFDFWLLNPQILMVKSPCQASPTCVQFVTLRRCRPRRLRMRQRWTVSERGWGWKRGGKVGTPKDPWLIRFPVQTCHFRWKLVQFWTQPKALKSKWMECDVRVFPQGGSEIFKSAIQFANCCDLVFVKWTLEDPLLRVESHSQWSD